MISDRDWLADELADIETELRVLRGVSRRMGELFGVYVDPEPVELEALSDRLTLAGIEIDEAAIETTRQLAEKLSKLRIP